MKNKETHKLKNIKNLDPKIRAEVDSMILSCEYTFREIGEYIAEKVNVIVPQTAVARYSLDLYHKQEEKLYEQKTKSQAFKN